MIIEISYLLFVCCLCGKREGMYIKIKVRVASTLERVVVIILTFLFIHIYISYSPIYSCEEKRYRLTVKGHQRLFNSFWMKATFTLEPHSE